MGGHPTPSAKSKQPSAFLPGFLAKYWATCVSFSFLNASGCRHWHECKDDVPVSPSRLRT
eukprot:357296-Chlamydomonas_euryale.AAC.2